MKRSVLNMSVEVKVADLAEKQAHFASIGVNHARSSFKMPHMYKITYKMDKWVNTGFFTRLPHEIGKLVRDYEDSFSTKTFKKVSLKKAYEEYEKDFCPNCNQRLTKLVQDRECKLRSKAKNCTAWMYNRTSASPLVASRVSDYTVNCSSHIPLGAE